MTTVRIGERTESIVSFIDPSDADHGVSDDPITMKLFFGAAPSLPPQIREASCHVHSLLIGQYLIGPSADDTL